jgi:MFS family permease
MDYKFHLPHGKLGSIISGTLLLSAFSNIFSSAISKKIGPVKAMVFTHLPSAVFLALTPAPSSLGWTVFLIAARSSIGTMDQAPCSVFLCAIFPSSDRTASLGILNAIKMLSHSGGPVITGVLMEAHRPWISFVAAGGLKALYDLGLLVFFAGTKINQLELEHADSEYLNPHHAFRSPLSSAELDRDSSITHLSLDTEPEVFHKRLSEDGMPFVEASRSKPTN